MEGKLASLLSLVMIRINGGQGLLDEDTSLSHVYESLLTLGRPESNPGCER